MLLDFLIETLFELPDEYSLNLLPMVFRVIRDVLRLKGLLMSN